MDTGNTNRRAGEARRVEAIEWGRRYTAGESLRAIAADAGVAPRTVSMHLGRLGVEIRDPGRPTGTETTDDPLNRARRKRRRREPLTGDETAALRAYQADAQRRRRARRQTE